MFSKLGGGALGAPAGMLGASRDPLRGGTLALLTEVTVVVTTRVPTMGWKALLFGGPAAKLLAETPTCPEGNALRVALLGGNPAMLGTCSPWATLAAII